MEQAVSGGNYPCKIEKQFLRPCTSLAPVLEPGSPTHARSKGLFLDVLLNLKTGEHSMSYVKMKLGKFLSKGMVINFCPFCGVNVSNHIKETLHDA